MSAGIASSLRYGQYTTNDLTALLGDEKHFDDNTATDGYSGSNNSMSRRSCVLVYNTSGGTLAPGNALTFTSAYHRKRVTKTAVGQAIHCFVPAVVNGSVTATIPNNSYFYAVYRGPTKFLRDASTVAIGDPLAVITTAGQVGMENIMAISAPSSDLTNSSTETTFNKSVIIPANTLSVGDIIKIRSAIVVSAVNATDTLVGDLLLNATKVCTSHALAVAANDLITVDVDLVVRTIGASGTVVASGFQHIGAKTVGAVATTTFRPVFLVSTTLDTTAAATIAVSAKWSAASANNTCALQVLDVLLPTKSRLANRGGYALETGTGASSLCAAYANCQW